MSLTTLAVLQSCGQDGVFVDDSRAAAGNATQTGAAPITGACTRFTVATASANSAILPSVLTGGGAPQIIVVNDTAVSVNVYPFVGEANGGTANAVTTIPTGQAAIFVRVAAGLLPSTALGWRSGIIA